MVRNTSNAPEGTPTWLDLGIPDIERARRFYGGLFGWEFHDVGPEGGHYRLCLKDGQQVAGVIRNDEPDADYWWQMYFATDDCDGTLKRVTDAGGTVVAPADDVLEQGRMAVVKDPTGAQFGLWQGRAHIGSAIVNEHGSLLWNELHTARGEQAREFYRAVFGLQAEPVAEAPGFVVLRRPDGRSIGGIQDDPRAARSTWVTYFAVDDVDAALRAVRDGGGSQVSEPLDTPWGRWATVRDPFGTEFRVMTPAPEPEG
ncbi:VOC family protein [Actinomadura kijaniata]|uniref:VOC domain-containing protein n=1 Tax=Actinomadura namibiensis TaxID=182080 RepID=A0A7W3QQ20_ACTNM|nr:VOC family protein [Actinomadura namibiensis]MBA8955274.1 hypothetical protein [Actinomadura namibiensis]